MMNKNFNIFEQHVEKFALAIAVAGAAYMVWIGYQDLTTADGTPLDQTENKVSAAVRLLHKAENDAATLQLPAPNVPIVIPQNRPPLPRQLADLKVPTFLPNQAPVQQVIVVRGKVGTGKVKTPTVGLPTDLTAVAWRGAGVPLTNAPADAAAAAAAPPATEDLDLVVLSAKLPLSDFIKSMATVDPIEQRLPGDRQNAAVYRVEVQRRVKTANGWGSWINVPQPEGLPQINWPKDLTKLEAGVVDRETRAVKDAFQPITQPLPPYVGLDGKQILLQIQNLPAPVKAALEGKGGVMPVAPAPVAPPPVMPPDMRPPDMRPPDMMRPPEMRPPDMRPPAVAPAVNPQPAAPEATDPYCWVVERRTDGPDSLEANREYQYRMRIVMINPTYDYHIDFGRPGELADESKRTEPLLYSGWEIAKQTVVMQGDMYVYFLGSRVKVGENTRLVDVQVFKWTSGRWIVDRSKEYFVGTPISGQITLPDKSHLPVNTGYTIVDAVTDGDDGKVKVTLLTSAGELIVRDSMLDKVDPRRKLLEAEAAKAMPAPKPKPGPGPAPGPVMPPNLPGVSPPRLPPDVGPMRDAPPPRIPGDNRSN